MAQLIEITQVRFPLSQKNVFEFIVDSAPSEIFKRVINVSQIEDVRENPNFEKNKSFGCIIYIWDRTDVTFPDNPNRYLKIYVQETKAEVIRMANSYGVMMD
jgi:hypothetical protein